MPRSRAFDEEEVLDQAAELFWRNGYEATSIADLESHLGLGRQSLYNAFGDKHQLFLRALEKYSVRNKERMTETLLRPDAGLEEIRTHFRQMAEFLSLPGPRKGCLVTNSLLEAPGECPEVQKTCLRNQRFVKEAFRNALSNAVKAGDLPEHFDVTKGVNLLVSQVYGLSVLAKAGASRRELRDSADALIDLL